MEGLNPIPKWKPIQYMVHYLKYVDLALKAVEDSFFYRNDDSNLWDTQVLDTSS